MSQETTVDLKEDVQRNLMLIRPQLQADGGDVELVDVDQEGIVSVRLLGACHGCPHATSTLEMGIERFLMERVPGVTKVVGV